MKYLFLLLIIFTASCRPTYQQHGCGDLVPVTSDKIGANTSLDGRICDYNRGKWTPVPNGPWYECRCEKSKETK